MDEKDFNFGEFRELKFTKYEKEYCKAAVVRKSKAALIFLDYKLAGKKTPCVVIPFKKFPEAFSAFKLAKATKESTSTKKIGLAKVTVGKGTDGKEEITVDLVKGGISPEMLISKGEDYESNK